jgi:hypothetical protein
MKTIGYNHPLYILPFDHRGSFQTRMFRAKVASHVHPAFSGADFGPRRGLESIPFNSKNSRWPK